LLSWNSLKLQYRVNGPKRQPIFKIIPFRAFVRYYHPKFVPKDGIDLQMCLNHENDEMMQYVNK